MDRKGFLLILLSSILLGIWATVNTIALRNLLLVFNAGLSIIYLREWLKVGDASLIKNHLRSTDFFYWLPSVLIVAMFIWVIAHYLLFSQYPQKQWDELSSTWLRAFMASVIGFGCALALRRNQSLAWMLWLGLIVSFLVLTYQYIPKAIANKSMFATDYFGNYIYWAKYSGVLAGTLLFAGALGLSIDNIRQLFISSGPKNSLRGLFKKFFLIFFIFLAFLLPLYAFVFIFNAKNGVGVTAILLIFWFVIGGIYLLIHFFEKKWYQYSNFGWIWWAVGYLVIIFIFFSFAYQHVKNNPGWGSLIEDIKVGTQVDKYHHWQNPEKFGFPTRSDGSVVAGNTYERTALIVVGLRIIAANPVGNGVSRSLPSQMRQFGIEYDHQIYTHSAWIDLGLSHGWLGLLLLPSALFLCLFICIEKYHGPYRATITSLAFSLLVLYLVGEYAFQHGIEILLFICSLVAALCWLNQSRLMVK